MEDIRQKIFRWKILCTQLKEEDKYIFIKFLEGNLERWSSAEILDIGITKLYFKPFKGYDIGKELEPRWINVIDIQEYKEGGIIN